MPSEKFSDVCIETNDQKTHAPTASAVATFSTQLLKRWTVSSLPRADLMTSSKRLLHFEAVPPRSSGAYMLLNTSSAISQEPRDVAKVLLPNYESLCT